MFTIYPAIDLRSGSLTTVGTNALGQNAPANVAAGAARGGAGA